MLSNSRLLLSDLASRGQILPQDVLVLFAAGRLLPKALAAHSPAQLATATSVAGTMSSPLNHETNIGTAKKCQEKWEIQVAALVSAHGKGC